MEDNAITKLIQDEKELTRQGVILDTVKAQVSQIAIKVDQLADKVDNKYVTRQEYEERQKRIDDILNKMASKEEITQIGNDVSSIKDSNKWVVRLVIGAVILGLIGLLIAPHLSFPT